MKVLIVGAGSVGQVLGYYYKQGGAEVTYYVKKNYLESTRAGFLLERRQSFPRKKVEDLSFKPFHVISKESEMAPLKWNLIVITVSSVALRDEWLDPFLKQIGDADVLTVQAGLTDEEFFLSKWQGQKLIRGMIGFLAFKGPLEGDSNKAKRTIFAWPPGGGMFFSGPGQKIKETRQVLKKGGMPTHRLSNVPARLAYSAALMMPVLVSLELNNWSIKKLGRSDDFRIAKVAVGEALAVAQKYKNKTYVSPPLFAWQLSLIEKMANRFFDFDLEDVIKLHFTKVRDQTYLYMNDFIRLGQKYGIEVSAIQSLMKRIEKRVS